MEERKLMKIFVAAFIVWLLTITICSMRVFHLENRVEYLELKLEEFIKKN